MSFHDDLILQDQASGERSQDQWSSGVESKHLKNIYEKAAIMSISDIIFALVQ